MADITIEIVHESLDPAAETGALAGRDASAGGLATFIGQVRDEPGLKALELEYYPGVTEQALQRIAQTAARRWMIARAVIKHRVGRMTLGEPIVFVAAAAAHRREALDAVGYMIDMLKTEAPFWKRVHTGTGAHWVEAVDADRDAADFWMEEIASEDA
jgi:molybdopterin synthase catalytic subunit